MITKALHKTRHFLRKYPAYYTILGFVQDINTLTGGSTKDLKKYYSECRIFMPKNSSWRQYRFWLSNGRCIKIHAQIRDEKTIRRYLLKYLPIFVTYSASAFLNPMKFGAAKSASNKINENIFLYNDLIIDVDSTDLKKARESALTVIKYMRDNGMEPESIVFSGSKGFHIKYADKKSYNDKNPAVREEMCANERRDFINRLNHYMKDNNHESYVDSEVTRNTRAFVRLPGTINCKTGYACWPITEEDLKKPISAMLENIPRIKRFPKSPNTDTAEPKTIMKMRLLLDRKQEHTGKNYSAFFISSRINDHESAVILRYKGRLLPEIISEVKNLQKKFLLGNFYLFRTEVKDEYFVICPDMIDNERFKRIINSSRCIHKQIAERHVEVFVRISRKIFADNEQSIPVEFLRTLQSSHLHNRVSRNHQLMLSDFNIRNISKDDKEKKHSHSQKIFSAKIIGPRTYHNRIVDGTIYSSKAIYYNKIMIR